MDGLGLVQRRFYLFQEIEVVLVLAIYFFAQEVQVVVQVELVFLFIVLIGLCGGGKIAFFVVQLVGTQVGGDLLQGAKEGRQFFHVRDVEVRVAALLGKVFVQAASGKVLKSGFKGVAVPHGLNHVFVAKIADGVSGSHDVTGGSLELGDDLNLAHLAGLIAQQGQLNAGLSDAFLDLVHGDAGIVLKILV